MRKLTYILLLWVCCSGLQQMYAQSPNWSVNASDFQYSMTFTTRLSVNGEYLTSTNDQVAAFVDGQIRGVANVQYVASKNKYIAFLSVFANATNETLQFKVYDSTQNLVVSIENTIPFEIDANIGGVFQSFSIAEPPLSDAATLTDFDFEDISSIAKQITTDKVTITVAETTNLSTLTPSFAVSEHATVYVNNVLQESGVTSHDFSNPIIYSVLSQDEATLTEYEVIVSSETATTTVELLSESLSKVNQVPVLIDIEFSNEVSTIEISDFHLNNAVVSSIQKMNATDFRVALVPKSQGVFSAQIKEGAVLDANNLGVEASNAIEFELDVTPPVIREVTSQVDGDTLLFAVTFSEEVLGVDVSDFELSGVSLKDTAIEAISVLSENRFQLQLSNQFEEAKTIALNLKSSSDIKDSAKNNVILSTIESYYINPTEIVEVCDGIDNDGDGDIDEGLEGCTLSIGDNMRHYEILLAPNPVFDRVELISKGEPIEKIILFDIYGRDIFQKEVGKEMSIIDLNTLPSGSYVLKIFYPRNIVTKKLIKK